MMRPLAVLYHCNDAFRCNKFINDASYLILSVEDGKWLGTGMYFWDNVGNAHYWKREKVRKSQNDSLNGHTLYSIVQAGVYTDAMLDLTDIEVCEKVELIWEEYMKSINSSEKYVPLGAKLNTLFECFGFFQSNYSVVKVIGKYPLHSENHLFSYRLNRNNPEPFTAAKCIYNVKSADVIAERKILER